jgi:PAP2 superfamily C-terminal
MKAIYSQYKNSLSDRKFIYSLIASLFFLGAAFIVNYYADHFATIRASKSVTDLILDNIPTFDVDLLYVWGGFMLVAIIAFSIVTKPKYLIFSIKSIALFIIIRSLFTMLTHIGQPLDQLVIQPTSIYGVWFFFSNDLFFSGHTGLPFLMALIFWQNKFYRNLYLLLSIFLAAIVLMGHYHYSIDVFAAYFITYGIYKISVKLFDKDN